MPKVLETEYKKSPLEISLSNLGGFSSIGRRVRVNLRLHYQKESIWYHKDVKSKCFETGDKESAKQIYFSILNELDEHLLPFNYKREAKLLDMVFYYINDGEKQYEVERVIENLKHKIIITKPDPVIIKFSEKQGDRFFIANSTIQAKLAYFKILKERLQIGWYDDSPDLIAIKTAIEESDFFAAYPLLSKRIDHEYEDFEVIIPTKI